MIEILRVLYDDIAVFDSNNPKLETRDRIIISKGHGVLAQYCLLADKGFFPLEELDKFCLKESMLGGHPSHHVPGVEASTGALGHGLSIGVGLALAAKMKGQQHRVFVIMGDGEIQEGSVWEAAMSASKHNLDNLTAIIDYNKIQSAGFVNDIQPLEPLSEKWKSFGWNTWECDGHDIFALEHAMKFSRLLNDEHNDCFRTDKPQVIIAHTVKGKGVAFAENTPDWHHKSGISDDIFEKMGTSLDMYA